MEETERRTRRAIWGRVYAKEITMGENNALLALGVDRKEGREIRNSILNSE